MMMHHLRHEDGGNMVLRNYLTTSIHRIKAQKKNTT